MKHSCLTVVWLIAVAAFAFNGVPASAFAPDDPPSEESLAEPEEGARDKQALLDALYQRLQQAETPEGAKAVAQRIERAWRKSDSATADLLLARAMALISAEEYSLALAILDTVVVSEPDFAEGWSQRAMAHFQKRDFSEALSDLRRVLALEPKHYRAMQGVAVILNEFGEKERALQAYRRVLEIYPTKKEALEAVDELEREVEGQDI